MLPMQIDVMPLLIACTVLAAEVPLTGTVRQQFTGLPVPGATTRLSGTVDITGGRVRSLAALAGAAAQL
jgi:hypothetical protein